MTDEDKEGRKAVAQVALFLLLLLLVSPWIFGLPGMIICATLFLACLIGLMSPAAREGTDE